MCRVCVINLARRHRSASNLTAERTILPPGDENARADGKTQELSGGYQALGPVAEPLCPRDIAAAEICRSEPPVDTDTKAGQTSRRLASCGRHRRPGRPA